MHLPKPLLRESTKKNAPVMKQSGNLVRCFTLAAGIAALFCSCQSSRTGEPVSANNNAQMYGYLYNEDGSPAANARVVLVASDLVPAALSKNAVASHAGAAVSTAPNVAADGVTDRNGRYSFAYVASGTYNIFGEGNGYLSYCPSVEISSAETHKFVASDTLKAPGGIKGIVITEPPTDSRRIFILVIGGYIVRWPNDSSGHFTINNLARGTYRIRFLPTDTDFPVLDTMITVSSGNVTDVGTITLRKIPAGDLAQNYLAMKLGVLVHFNMSTFDRCCCEQCYSVSGEWGLANTDENEFHPSALNCGQWADAAKAAGAKYMILTVKHHDGFCLWNSAATQHDVGSCSWAGGKRDVVREFTDSARARGLKAGFYYSIRDLTNGYSGDFIKTQLNELLSNYGEITCLFFDGWGWGPGYNAVPYSEIYSFVKSIQPNCLVIDNNHEYSLVHSEIAEYETPIDGTPKIGNTLPAEGFEPIRTDGLWFWHPNKECTLFSAQHIVDQLHSCNSRNANYLLNVTPDTTGLLPQCQVDTLKAVGALRSN